MAITYTRIYVDVTVVGYPFKLTRITILSNNFSIWTCEIIGWKSFRAPMPVAYGLKDILDVEGRTHRVLYVDCSVVEQLRQSSLLTNGNHVIPLCLSL